jgi:hypothetical protein
MNRSLAVRQIGRSLTRFKTRSVLGALGIIVSVLATVYVLSVAGFMGDANRVHGVLMSRNGTHATVALGATTLSLPHRGLPEGDVELSIRPESITLKPSGATPLAGTVRKAAYLGGIMEYTIDTGIGELFAISTAVDQPHAVGDDVSIELARHGVVLVPPGRSNDSGVLHQGEQATKRASVESVQ